MMQVNVTTQQSSPWEITDKYNCYRVENGKLYYQSLGRTDWKIISFVKTKTPLASNADFEDLMVLDENGNIHYTKTQANMDSPEWQSGIFDLPIISEIFNRYVYSDPFPKGSSLWSVSFIEKGKIYRDLLQRKHQIDSGLSYGETTLLIVYDDIHRGFRCYDPFCFKGPEDKEIFLYLPLPETSESIFELKGLSSCASQIMLLGYEVVSCNGCVKKTLCLYTIFADTNTMGENPLLEYTYDKNSKKYSEFVLPVALYRKHTLPPGLITKCIKILRTSGNEPEDRLLEIEGMMHDGKCGFWQKKINDEEWSFVPSYKIISIYNILPIFAIDPAGKFQTSIYNYISQSKKEKLLNFGKNSLQSSIITEEETIFLYRKQSKLNFLGFNWTDYTLVFSNGSMQNVIIEEKEGSLVIESNDLINKKILYRFFRV